VCACAVALVAAKPSDSEEVIRMMHRLRWLLRLRRLAGEATFGHWLSWVDEASTLEGHNYLAQRAKVIRSHLGLFSYVNYDSIVSNSHIGRYTCIGPASWVGGLGQHPIDRRSTHRMFYSDENKAWSGFCYAENFSENKRTSVGNDVWIGARCMVMDGVHIGDGAIIAAGAVVTANVAPYSIVGGIPAREIRKRFDQNTIDYLLNERWWDKNETSVRLMAIDGGFSQSLQSPGALDE
jgi:hypothetical protein